MKSKLTKETALYTLAGLLHDIGKFAERAGMTLPDGYRANNEAVLLPEYQGRYSHVHALYSAAFIEKHQEVFHGLFSAIDRLEGGGEDNLRNLAARHHKPESAGEWVVALADRISSGLDREEFEDYNKGVAVKDYRKTRLLSVFEGILPEPGEKESLEDFEWRMPLASLSADSVIPRRREDSSREEADREYRNLFQDFEAEFVKLADLDDPRRWLTGLDSLLLKYTNTIPAATVGKTIPDVSLYDHLRSVGALAAALYLWARENPGTELHGPGAYEQEAFCLLQCSFNGIQNFIFESGSETNRGAAKILRGRSFWVSTIVRLAAQYILEEAGLPNQSLILDAAGKFTIIGPNTKDFRETAEKVGERINDWLIDEFYGEVSLSLASVGARGNDFNSGNFPLLWDRLLARAEEKKFSAFDLTKRGGADTRFLEKFDSSLDNPVCPLCGKRPSIKTEHGPAGVENACGTCQDHKSIGQKLVHNSWLAIYRSDDTEAPRADNSVTLFGLYNYRFYGRQEALDQAFGGGKSVLVFNLNEEPGIGGESRFINNYIPKYGVDWNDEGLLELILGGRKSEAKKEGLFEELTRGLEKPEDKEPVTFEMLSRLGMNLVDGGDGKKPKLEGVAALGVLKADVDQLGMIFGAGLRHYSLGRVCNLSRQLQFFFGMVLGNIFRNQPELRGTYTVFAGGDDLFLIGPWRQIFHAAEFIQEKFADYVCHNPRVTFSAGISLSRPGEPIPTMAARGEEALELSKQRGRRRLTVFDETITWEEAEPLRELRENIRNWLRKGVISKALIYRMMDILESAGREEILQKQERIDPGDFRHLKWRSALQYSLARNLPHGEKAKGLEEELEQVNQLGGLLAEYRGKFKIPLWYTLYSIRGVRD